VSNKVKDGTDNELEDISPPCLMGISILIFPLKTGIVLKYTIFTS